MNIIPYDLFEAKMLSIGFCQEQTSKGVSFERLFCKNGYMFLQSFFTPEGMPV